MKKIISTTEAPAGPSLPICEAAGRARARNSPATPGLEAQCQAVIVGLLAYYQPTDTFLMSDGTFTRDQLIARFQAFVAAVEQTKSDYQIWRTDVAS